MANSEEIIKAFLYFTSVQSVKTEVEEEEGKEDGVDRLDLLLSSNLSLSVSFPKFPEEKERLLSSLLSASSSSSAREVSGRETDIFPFEETVRNGVYFPFFPFLFSVTFSSHTGDSGKKKNNIIFTNGKIPVKRNSNLFY
jgi:hypothetical protein